MSKIDNAEELIKKIARLYLLTFSMFIAYNATMPRLFDLPVIHLFDMFLILVLFRLFIEAAK